MIEKSLLLHEEQNVKIYVGSGEQELKSRTIHDYALNEHYWQENDSLSVFMRDGKNRVFSLVEGAGTQSGGFMGLIWSGTGDSSSAMFPNNVAYYPYNKYLAATYLGEGVYSLSSTLPSKQLYGGDGTFAQYAYPMIGVTEDNTRINYKLKAVASAAVIHLRSDKDVKISKIILKANGHKIAGDFTVTASYDGEPKAIAAGDAVDFITLDCPEPVQLNNETAVKFWITALPINYNEGDLTADIYDSNGGYMKDVNLSPYGSDNHKLSRNTRKNFGWDEGKYIVYRPGGNLAEDLISMLNEAKSGDVIDFTLPIDIELDETAIIKDHVTLNLDLNGHTITSAVTNGSAWSVGRLNGVLNIKNGRLANTSGSASVNNPSLIEVNCAGGNYESKLSLENVTIENNLIGTNKASYAISYNSTSSVTLDNVTMTSVADGIKSSGQVRPAGQGLWIKSGTYTATGAVLAQGSNGSLYGTVDGGYFKSENAQCIGVSTSSSGTNTGINVRGGFFADNKFSYVGWEASGNADYPYAPAVTGYTYDETNKVGEIWSAKGMQTFYNKLIAGETYKDGTVKLTASIDMSGFEWDSHSETGSTNFAGTFDGGNNTIRNLTLVAGKAGGYATLFNYFSGEVKDLTIDGVTATDMDASGRASAVVGYAYSGKLSGVTVKNLTATGFQKVAGLVSTFQGYNELTIEDCHVEKATLKPNGVEDPLWQAGAILGYASSFKQLIVANSSVLNITVEKAPLKSDCSDQPYYSHAFIGNLDCTLEGDKTSEVELTNNKVENSTSTDVYVDYSSDYYAFGKARKTAKMIITIDNERKYPPFVAKVNGQSYETVGEAIASVENNGTATISLVAGEYTLPEVKGKTITFEPAVEGELVKINVAEAAHIDTKYEGSTLNFKNVTLVGTKYAGNTQGYQKATAENYNNCTFENYYMFAGDDVTVTDCTFKGVEGQYFWTGSASNVTFTRCKFNGVDRALKVLSVGNPQDETRNVTFNECEFTASKSNKAVLEFDSPNATSNYKVVLNNSTKSDVFPAWFSDKSSTDSKYLVVINGAYYVSSANDLAGCLTSSEEDIKVVLCADIDVPITSLGNQTPGSGEYKLGGENTNKITIDLNQKKLNITTTYWSGIGAKNDNATITIKNGTMTSSQTSGTWNSYDLTLANCNYVIEDVDFAKSIAFTNTGKTVHMKDVNIVETHDYYAIWISAEGQTVTIDGGMINSGGRGIKIDEEYSEADNALVNLTVKNYTFNTLKKGAILVKSAKGANITLDNVDISNVAADKDYAVWCDEDAAHYASSITVNGGKMKVEGTTIVADGVLLNKAGEYELSSLAGFRWFQDQVNAQRISFAGKTVKLTADIDLAGIDWEPIGQTGRTTFNGVFDGQNHTICNLNVDSDAEVGANYSSGLFGWVESHTANHGHLKNVKINNATIKGHHNCGALVGCITKGTALVENCHVTGATISCTNANDAANGDKAGALIGNATVETPVKDCTASNSTVSSGRDAGQLIGAGKEANVTGCSATNVTVSANGTGTGANVREEVIGRLL